MIEIKGTTNAAQVKFRTEKHLFASPLHIQVISMEDDYAIVCIKGWELRVTLEDASRIVDQMHNFMIFRNPNA